MGDRCVVIVKSTTKPGENDEITLSTKNEAVAESETHGEQQSEPFCECVTTYSSSTSIHGVQYLGETNRPVWERLFWFAVFIVSMYCCSYMIHKLWKKWEDTPVIVSFDERETEIWKIPFPAVTICPQVKAAKDIFSFEDVIKMPWEDLSEDNKTYLRVLLNLCDTQELFYERFNSNASKAINIIDVIQKLSPNLKTIVMFQDIVVEDALSPIITEEGLCYNFNGLALKEIFSEKSQIPNLNYTDVDQSAWDREQGYKKSTKPDAHPMRVLGSGLKLGINIFLFSNKTDTDKVCMIPSDGYKVLVHAPDNIPQMSWQFFNLPVNQHVVAAIKPNILWTSEKLRQYSFEMRKCYFSNEQTLTFFQRYTQINCKLECLTFHIFYNCGCVAFYMPRMNEMKICQTVEELKCIEQNEKHFLHIQANIDAKINAKEFCNCLPPCTSIFYSTETSQSYIDLDILLKMANNTHAIDDLERMDLSTLTIYFKESTFLSSKRSELYGVSEFLANCGGLLGLFVGVSILSFVEIFYFSTIRIITNFMRHRTREQSL